MAPSLRKFRLPALILAGIGIFSLVILLGLRKTITVVVDGSSQEATVFALRVSDALRSMNIALSPEDSLTPSLNSLLKNKQGITLVRAIPVQVLADGKL